MEPNFRSKLRTLFLGLLFPAVLLYAGYFASTEIPGMIIHDNFLFFSDFYKRYMNDEISEPARPRLVVLGDSTSKASYNPGFEPDLPAVNFGFNHGTGMIAYHVLEELIEKRGPPACLLVIYQWNSEKNYSSFFDAVLFTRSFSFERVEKIWRSSREGPVFPADGSSHLDYLMKSALAMSRLSPLPISDLQKYVFGQAPSVDEELSLRRQLKNRGAFFSNRTEPINRPFFDRSLYGASLKPFSPSLTDDFYFRRILKLAEEKKMKVFFAITPVADAPEFANTAAFRAARDRHMRELFSSATELTLPGDLPREDYYDFFHVNVKGATVLTAHMAPTLKAECGGEP
jgi:hypothetical protein